MSDSEELRYTTVEIRSFLPLGWDLAQGEDEGHWDPALRMWTVTMVDGSDLEWPISVKVDKAESMGRLEALEEAMRRQRTRLGS